MRHSEEEDLITKSYKFPVKSIHMINSNNFVIHEEGTNNIRLLSIKYEGTSFFEEKLIFRESSHDIVKIQANKDNLYILSQNGSEYSLKCFILESNLELTPTGLLERIEKSNPTFIEEFERSNCINANILISN